VAATFCGARGAAADCEQPASSAADRAINTGNRPKFMADSLATDRHREDGFGRAVFAGVFTAWADESGSDPRRDPHTYMLGVALIDEVDVASVRAVMSDCRLAIERKVHWHGSSEARRLALVETVADLPIVGLVAVRNEVGATDRRLRRKCMEQLLPNLAQIPCGTITDGVQRMARRQ
jgi:hypothetical protein